LSYQLTVHERKGYLHVVATGVNGPEAVKAYLQEAAKECVARGHKRLLIEERLEGPRLGILDVFEIVTHGVREARKVLDSIAYVDVHSEGTLMKLAGGLASQMGLSVRLFPDVEEASHWLGKGPEGT
jgi:hypothetical protein